MLTPALIVAAIAGFVGYGAAVPDHRAIGSVALSEIAGNRPAYELNTFAADFETALASPGVDRAVEEAVADGERVSEVEVTRLGEASLLTLSLTASGERDAREALLAAGRAAYQQVVQQQRDLLLVRARASDARLEQLSAEVDRLRQNVAAAPAEDRPALQALVDQRRQAVGIAVQEQSDAEGGLAVAERVASRLDSGTGSVVQVGEVRATSVLPQVLNVMAAGLLAGALAGLLAAFLLYRRPARAGDDRRTRMRPRGLGRDSRGQVGEPTSGAADEVHQPSLTP